MQELARDLGETEDASWSWESLGGLSPSSWLCVGEGYSREELKTGLLARGLSLSDSAVTNTLGLAQRVLEARPESGFRSERLLGKFARQEALKALIARPEILDRLPEVKRLRRGRTHLRKLDRALQAGRKVFSSEAEESVLEERLKERLGEGTGRLRYELRMLALAWQVWLEQHHLWDDVRLLREATLAVSEAPISWPERILDLSLGTREGLEESFWNELGRKVECVKVHPGRLCGASAPPQQILGRRWHTWDDACRELAERFASEAPDWSQNPWVVVIPDQPALRRSLMRALEAAKVPLSDTRDPSRLRWDEGIKRGLLPLEVVASRFERERVFSWIGHQLSPEQAQEIHDRGIRSGLEAYSGGRLEWLYGKLERLEKRFSRRLCVKDLKAEHLAELDFEASRSPELVELLPFFESIWDAIESDLELLEGEKGLTRRAPLLFWIEKLRERIQEGSPPVDYARPRHGLAIYRLTQAPLTRFDRVVFLGLPSDWLGGESVGDAWFSARDREALAADFTLRSGMQQRQERKALLDLWWGASRGTVEVIDAAYEWKGRERESLAPLFKSWGKDLPELIDCGGNAAWSPSHGPAPEMPVRVSQLGRDPGHKLDEATGKPLFRATDVDRFSQCSFIGLTQSRWKLRDVRTSEPDLWPDQQGVLLHAAVRVLVEARSDDGVFSISPEQALEKAWEEHRLKGLWKGQRLHALARKRLLPVLKVFCEKEAEYTRRSGARVSSLEGPELRMDFGDFVVAGRPDRIDQHEAGLFVIDYKSGSKNAKGRQMIDDGYKLQLPFYALAVQGQLGRTAVGVQFVELNRKAARSQGIFFKAWNGKKPGCLTATTANSTSLISEEPENVWSKVEDHLLEKGSRYLAGEFEARPIDPKDCDSCRTKDLCGARRRGIEEEE